MECFVTSKMKKEIDSLSHFKLNSFEETPRIAEFALPRADQVNVAAYYGTNSTVQLDASAYDQPERVAIKPLQTFMWNYYIAQYSDFSHGIYNATYRTVNLPAGQVMEEITSWTHKILDEDLYKPESEQRFTLLEMAYLKHAGEEFLETVQEEEDGDY